MSKIHTVREPFSLDGVEYPRGTEIADEDTLAKVKASHGHHLTQTGRDIAPAKASPKPAQ